MIRVGVVNYIRFTGIQSNLNVGNIQRRTGFKSVGVRLKSKLYCFDNTGARLLEVIRPCKQNAKHGCRMGRAFIGVVKKCESGKMVQRKQIIKGMLVTSKFKERRPDGSYIQFNQNRYSLYIYIYEMIMCYLFMQI